MIVFWVGAGAGLLAGWACGWGVTSWWRDRHDQADDEYAEELVSYPHVGAHEPVGVDRYLADLETRGLIERGSEASTALGMLLSLRGDFGPPPAPDHLPVIGTVVDPREDTLVRVARLRDRDDISHQATAVLLLPPAALMERLSA